MKAHRPYVVNLEKITTVERSRIVFGLHYIPVAYRYKEAFQRYLSGD